MPKIPGLGLLMLLAITCGCAENAAYNTAQRSAQVECNKEPTQELYQQCINKNSMPYREYKAEKNQP